MFVVTGELVGFVSGELRLFIAFLLRRLFKRRSFVALNLFRIEGTFSLLEELWSDWFIFLVRAKRLLGARARAQTLTWTLYSICICLLSHWRFHLFIFFKAHDLLIFNLTLFNRLYLLLIMEIEKARILFIKIN